MFEKSVQGIGNTALAEYERVRWETLELLLEPEQQEALIDGAMTPVMRDKLGKLLWALEDEGENTHQFIETVCRHMPKALTEKLAKNKKESFMNGIRRLKKAAQHLLEGNQLPTVDRLLDLLDNADVKGVDWSWITEDFDDDGNPVRVEPYRYEHRGIGGEKDWDVYLECGGRVEYFLDYLLTFGK